jgi:hypothetical protein
MNINTQYEEKVQAYKRKKAELEQIEKELNSLMRDHLISQVRNRGWAFVSADWAYLNHMIGEPAEYWIPVVNGPSMSAPKILKKDEAFVKHKCKVYPGWEPAYLESYSDNDILNEGETRHQNSKQYVIFHDMVILPHHLE